MGWVVQAVITGITAFVATNIDDIVILTLFFAQINAGFRPDQIVLGQYLGFCVLIAASLPGFFGGLLIPKAWIGLLGLVPIALGISQFVCREDKEMDVQIVSCEVNRSRGIASFLAPQTYNVAAVTVANGGDNIGIYVPLFANNNLISLGVILSVFLVMVGVWCYIGYHLSRHPAIAPLLTRYGHKIVPFVLIGLGIFILTENYL
ncbi:MAG: transporter [Leptolyngbyaceae cyanobacterium RU_5_1]|nr:transporter [Leptolyngbyaceae cyanobacterium RU_5_1]